MSHVKIARAGKELGSFTESDVRAGLVRGSFMPTDHYWMPGMSSWAILRQLYPELCNATTPPALPAAAPAAPANIIINNTVDVKNDNKSGGCSSGCGWLLLFIIMVSLGALGGPFGVILAVILFFVIWGLSRR